MKVLRRNGLHAGASPQEQPAAGAPNFRTQVP